MHKLRKGGRPHKLTMRQLFEMAKLIRIREMKHKDIAHMYGIHQNNLCDFFSKHGQLTDRSIRLIKKELLKQINSDIF